MNLAARVAVTVEPTPVETAPRRELTARALLVGGAIGAVLAAGNVYTGLKISIIDGGSITAALLGFMFFATFTRLGAPSLQRAREQHHPDHGRVGGDHGLRGGRRRARARRMALLGRQFPGWALCVWGLAVALVGIVAAALLRRKLVVDEALPFPDRERHRRSHRDHLRGARQRGSPGAVPDRGRGGGGGRDLVPRRSSAPHPRQHGLRRARSAASRSAALTVGMSWSPLLLSTGRHDGPADRGQHGPRLGDRLARHRPLAGPHPHRQAGGLFGLSLLVGLARARPPAGGAASCR